MAISSFGQLHILSKTKDVSSKMTVGKILIHAFFFSICVAGFLWQEGQISAIYFQYEVVTRISLTIPDKLDAPSFSACFRYSEITDFKRIDEEKRANLSWAASSGAEEILESLIISDVFKYSPNESDAIECCRYRTPGTFLFDRIVKRDKCLKAFEIKKFFFGNFMCYRYRFILSNRSYSYPELAYASRDSGLIYEVQPGEKFFPYKEAKFVVHTGTTYPAKSIALSPLMENIKWSSQLPDSRYTLTFYKLVKYKLPAPFVT